MCKRQMITQIGSLPYDDVERAVEYSLQHDIPFLQLCIVSHQKDHDCHRNGNVWRKSNVLLVPRIQKNYLYSKGVLEDKEVLIII